MATLKGIKRISQELQDIQKNPVINWSAGVIDEKDMFKWEATLMELTGSPYEGGFFFLNIQFPPDYPLKPPRLTFVTRIYHPNINSSGAIRIGILSSSWNSTNTIRDVLNSISTMLTSPNVDDPLSDEVARIYREDNSRYEAIAREWTKRYAM
jgi:ubiquitin-conjugating enzyme E2 D/E